MDLSEQASFITGPGVTRGRVIDDHGFFHVSDWFPTILSATETEAAAEKSVGGSAAAGMSSSTPKKPQLPLDGISAWAALTSSSRLLPRTEMIIQYDVVLPPSPASGCALKSFWFYFRPTYVRLKVDFSEQADGRHHPGLPHERCCEKG